MEMVIDTIGNYQLQTLCIALTAFLSGCNFSILVLNLANYLGNKGRKNGV